MDWLNSDRIYLRAPEPEDLDFLYRWENDTALWGAGTTITPYSRYQLRRFIADSSHDIYQDKQLRLMVVLTGTKQVVGTIDLFDFDPFHGRAEVGVLVATENRRQQIASEALGLQAEYAFGFLKVNQLYAYIPVSNAASLSLFYKVGYEKTGMLKSWQRTEKGFEDVAVVQLLRSSFIGIGED